MRSKLLAIVLGLVMIVSGVCSAGEFEFYGGMGINFGALKEVNDLLEDWNDWVGALDEDSLTEVTKFSPITRQKGYHIGGRVTDSKLSFGIEYESLTTKSNAEYLFNFDYVFETDVPEPEEITIDVEISIPMSYSISVSGISGNVSGALTDNVYGFLGFGRYTLGTDIGLSAALDSVILSDDISDDILEANLDASVNIKGSADAWGGKIGVMGSTEIYEGVIIQGAVGYRYLKFPVQTFTASGEYSLKVSLSEEYQEPDWENIDEEQTFEDIEEIQEFIDEILGEGIDVEEILDEYKHVTDLSGLFFSIGLAYRF